MFSFTIGPLFVMDGMTAFLNVLIVVVVSLLIFWKYFRFSDQSITFVLNFLICLVVFAK